MEILVFLSQLCIHMKLLSGLMVRVNEKTSVFLLEEFSSWTADSIAAAQAATKGWPDRRDSRCTLSFTRSKASLWFSRIALAFLKLGINSDHDVEN